MAPIGLQLYSLREDAAKDFPGTIEKVAEIGYKGVEFAGLHGHRPKEIADLVSDLGMQVTSSHVGLPTPETVHEIAQIELTLGNRSVISGFDPDDMETLDQCKAAAEKFAQAAELLKPYGMRFLFHNHWWEFRIFNGKTGYDIIMEEAPNVLSELDIYWAAFAKFNPVEIIKKYTARIPILHVKDGPLGETPDYVALGEGDVDVNSAVHAADANTLDWLIVELDECKTDMLEAVEKSFDYLTVNV